MVWMQDGPGCTFFKTSSRRCARSSGRCENRPARIARGTVQRLCALHCAGSPRRLLESRSNPFELSACVRRARQRFCVAGRCSTTGVQLSEDDAQIDERAHLASAVIARAVTRNCVAGRAGQAIDGAGMFESVTECASGPVRLRCGRDRRCGSARESLRYFGVPRRKRNEQRHRDEGDGSCRERNGRRGYRLKP